VTQIINLYSALWNPLDSYGRLAHETRKALTRLGVYVNCFGEKAPQEQPIRPAWGGLFISPAGYYDQLNNPLSCDGPRVAVTMFESTHLPPKWITPLNQCDHIIVPAHWLVDVMADNGVMAPVSVVPLGVSEPYLHCAPRNARNKVCTFYIVGDSGVRGRKGWSLAGWAFVKAFGDSPNHRLIIKARAGGMNFTFTNPNITLLQGEYSDRAMHALYCSTDAMVFPSRGEGFGLPPREYAGSGGAVAVTNWSGLTDDLDAWGYPLPYRMTRAWQSNTDYSALGGRWAEAGVDEIAEWMLWYNDHRAEANERAVEAAKAIKRLYSWDNFGAQVLRAWEQTCEDFYGNSITAKSTAR